MADLGDGGDDERTLAALDAAIVAGHEARVGRSHVAWTTGARPADPPDRRPRPRPRRAVRGRRGAGHRRDPGRRRRARHRLLRDARPRSGSSGRRGWPRSTSGRGSCERARQTFAGYFSYASHDLAGAAEPWPDARRFETSGLQPDVGRRDGTEHRLAVDVRGSRLGPPARAAARSPARGPAGRDRRRRAGHAAGSDGHPGHVPHPGLADAGRVRRDLAAVVRDLPDAADRRAPDQRRLLQHRGRARAVRVTSSSWSPATPRRRSRRARPWRSSGRIDDRRRRPA